MLKETNFATQTFWIILSNPGSMIIASKSQQVPFEKNMTCDFYLKHMRNEVYEVYSTDIHYNTGLQMK